MLVNASWFELAIDVVLLIGVWAKVWLIWQSRLDTKALEGQKLVNGRRDEIRVEVVRAWASLYVMLILLTLTGYYTFFVPEPRNAQVAQALVISEMVYASIVLALVLPARYAVRVRKRQLRRYLQEQERALLEWDGVTERRET
jgi:cation transporter-like permease